jgi:hypothetical protein
MIPAGNVATPFNPDGVLATRRQYDARTREAEKVLARAAHIEENKRGTDASLLRWYLVEVPPAERGALRIGTPLVLVMPERNAHLMRTNGAPLYEAHTPLRVAANTSNAHLDAAGAYNRALPALPRGAFFAGIVYGVNAPCDFLQSMQWVCVQREGLARVAREYVDQPFLPPCGTRLYESAPRCGKLLSARFSNGRGGIAGILWLGFSLGTSVHAPYNVAISAEAALWTFAAHAVWLETQQRADTIAITRAPRLSLLTNAPSAPRPGEP